MHRKPPKPEHEAGIGNSHRKVITKPIHSSTSSRAPYRLFTRNLQKPFETGSKLQKPFEVQPHVLRQAPPQDGTLLAARTAQTSHPERAIFEAKNKTISNKTGDLRAAGSSQIPPFAQFSQQPRNTHDTPALRKRDCRTTNTSHGQRLAGMLSRQVLHRGGTLAKA